MRHMYLPFTGAAAQTPDDTSAFAKLHLPDKPDVAGHVAKLAVHVGNRRILVHKRKLANFAAITGLP